MNIMIAKKTYVVALRTRITVSALTAIHHRLALTSIVTTAMVYAAGSTHASKLPTVNADACVENSIFLTPYTLLCDTRYEKMRAL